MTEVERALVEAVLKAYHTTRLDPDPVPHILAKPYVRDAFAAITSVRENALEEAAGVAEYRGPFGDAAYQTPKEIAAAIRSLIADG